MYAPRPDEFARLAGQGNLIPVYRRILADFETPLSAYRKLRGQGESFLFESVEGGEHLGRYSFVGCNPRAVVIQRGPVVEVRENGRVTEQFTVARAPGPGTVADVLVVVERVLARYRPVALPGLPRFTGGAVGFLGYEFIHDVEPVVPRPPADELGTPTAYFLIADELLVFDRVAQTITVLANAFLDGSVPPDEAYHDAVSEIERLVALLEQPLDHQPVSLPEDAPALPFTSNTPREKFLANVTRAKEYITAGDIIQVVGSQRFSARVTAPPVNRGRPGRATGR